MRILIHDYAGHPFQVQLSRELASRGHRVHHVYNESLSTPRGRLRPGPDDPESFSIEGIRLKNEISKYSYIRRLVQERTYGRRLSGLIRRWNPEVVLCGNTPPDAQAGPFRTCTSMETRFLFWLQDSYAIGVRRLLGDRVPVVGPVLAWYYERLENHMLRKSDAVVLISEEFHGLLDLPAGTSRSVHVIPNWAPLDEIPVRPKVNPWSRRHGLRDRFCFLYSGTLGLKHNPRLLVELAEWFRDDNDVVVVVVSSGSGAAWLRKQKRQRGLTNLRVLDFQPFEELPDVLASGDVLLALLTEDAGAFSVPSKVLSYLCARRPLLLSVPEDNHAACVVRSAGAGKLAVPQEVPAFLDAAQSLRDDAALRSRLGASGRAYAEATFDIGRIADRFEEILMN